MNKQKAVTILEAFFIMWAVVRMCAIPATHIMTLAIFFLAYMGIEKVKKMESKRSIQVVSMVFTFLYTAGGMEYLWGGLDSKLFRIGILGVCIIGMYCLFFRVLSLVYEVCNQIKIEGSGFSKKLPYYSFGICLIAWLPYFLKNFPGIMTIDSMNQYAQIIGVYSPNNHHPWIHTQIIKFFYEIGMILTKDPTIAIAFYTCFQMLFMAACVSYLMDTLRKQKVKKGFLIAVLAFYALVPYQGIYAVTIWKDPMFAGSVLLYVVSAFRLYESFQKQEVIKLAWKEFVIFAFAGVGMSLLRSNGWYAFLLCIPFFILAFKGIWRKRIVLLQVLMLIGILVVKGPIMNRNEVIQPDLIESLSIPAQQISRVIVEGKELTKEQSAFLNRILDVSKIESLYNPYVSDGFKRLAREGNPQYLEEHFPAFLKLYINLGLKYPKEYLLAFRDQSIGYYFPSQEGLIAADEGVIPNEFGLENRPIISGKLIVKIQEVLLKMKDIIPGYGVLWSMGAMTWLLILSAGIMWAKGKKEYLFLYMPVAAIFLTLVIATPVAKDFRYFYAITFAMPFYILLALTKPDSL